MGDLLLLLLMFLWWQSFSCGSSRVDVGGEGLLVLVTARAVGLMAAAGPVARRKSSGSLGCRLACLARLGPRGIWLGGRLGALGNSRKSDDGGGGGIARPAERARDEK